MSVTRTGALDKSHTSINTDPWDTTQVPSHQLAEKRRHFVFVLAPSDCGQERWRRWLLRYFAGGGSGTHLFDWDDLD